MSDESEKLKQALSEFKPNPMGCPCCGGLMVLIRGKFPGQDKRKVCPICMRDRLDTIEEMASEYYGVAVREESK